MPRRYEEISVAIFHTFSIPSPYLGVLRRQLLFWVPTSSPPLTGCRVRSAVLAVFIAIIICRWPLNRRYWNRIEAVCCLQISSTALFHFKLVFKVVVYFRLEKLHRKADELLRIDYRVSDLWKIWFIVGHFFDGCMKTSLEFRVTKPFLRTFRLASSTAFPVEFSVEYQCFTKNETVKMKVHPQYEMVCCVWHRKNQPG